MAPASGGRHSAANPGDEGVAIGVLVRLFNPAQETALHSGGDFFVQNRSQGLRLRFGRGNKVADQFLMKAQRSELVELVRQLVHQDRYRVVRLHCIPQFGQDAIPHNGCDGGVRSGVVWGDEVNPEFPAGDFGFHEPRDAITQDCGAGRVHQRLQRLPPGGDVAFASASPPRTQTP
jgi:hypothetical protein